MDLNSITIANFKARFFRDFPYLPSYDNAALYNTGDIVYYATTKLFYSALQNGVTGVAPNADPAKWGLLVPQQDIDNYIQDQDITNAFAEAQISFNQALFGTDAQITLGYLYLTAAYLCNDIKASRAGIMSAAAFPMTSRSVGSVSESYGIPQAYLEDPLLAFYTQSAYGLKYLALVLPKLRGNIVAVQGMTRP